MLQETETNSTQFELRFHSILNQNSTQTEPDNLLENLVGQAGSTGKLFQELGDNAFYSIQNLAVNDQSTDQDLLQEYIITYTVAESLKYFMILWRDSIFQLQKSRLFSLENAANKTAHQQLAAEIVYTLQSSGKELTDAMQYRFSQISTNPSSYKKQLKKWSLEQNPWPVYNKQLQDLIAQCETLHKNHLIIYKTATGFKVIQERILEAVKFCQLELKEVNGLAKLATDFIAKEAQTPVEKQLQRIADKLKSLEAQVSLTYHIETFNTQLEDELLNIAGETEFTIQIQQGWLLQNKINFKKRVSLWLNREILPLLFEVWEITELSKNGLKMALQNIRNMAVVSSTETPENNLQIFLNSLNTLKENNTQSLSRLTEFSEILSERITSDLKLSLIYDTNSFFLPFSSGTTISNRLNLGKSKLLKVSHSWVTDQLTKLKSYREKVVHEFTLSRSEKMVRYLQVRQREESNNHYTSFFTTKGYFGDLFAIGRDSELAHLSLIIKNWHLGFNGSAIITGHRYSGKTLIGELIASRNFAHNTLRLSPGQSITLQGRKMQSSYKLIESLDFIAKNKEHAKYLIWIDDLELWWEPSIPLYRNVKDLLGFIDRNSTNFFFIVSTNVATFHQLKMVKEIDRVFQAHIYLRKLTAKEIEKSLIIRHLATHRELLNEKNENIRPAEFRRIAKEITQLSKGNIGDALNLWSYLCKRVDDNTVIYKPLAQSNFPEFFRPDLAVLLTSVILQKRTNEYRLRKLFGPAFSDIYQPILIRLISIRVIERQLDGWLEINERVANELGYMLNARQYLNY